MQIRRASAQRRLAKSSSVGALASHPLLSSASDFGNRTVVARKRSKILSPQKSTQGRRKKLPGSKRRHQFNELSLNAGMLGRANFGTDADAQGGPLRKPSKGAFSRSIE